MTPSKFLRVVVVQPSLAQFRIPLFRALAAQQGVQLRVRYAASPNRPNVDPDGFFGEYAPMWIRRIGGHPIYWHPAQWKAADRATTDVLVLNWDVHYASLVPALLRARAKGVPTILWGHGYSRHTSLWRAGPRRSLARLATALLFYNETGRRMYADIGWDKSRLFVALNSLDQGPIQAARDQWLREPNRLAQFRREQGLAAHPVVLFVSRLDAARRVDLLLRAAHALRDRHPQLRVVLVGTGPAEPDLRTLAASLGIADRVRFVGACYAESELAPWFLSADLFCYPAHMGLSLLHAFGYGLPVVTSDATAEHGPEIEALVPGENGLLYADGNAFEMARTMDTLLDDASLRLQLGRAARCTVQERFTLNRMVTGFEAAVRFAAAAAIA